MFDKYEKLNELELELQALGFKRHEATNELVFVHKVYGGIHFTDNGYRLNFISISSRNFTVFYYAPIPNENIYNEVLNYAKLICCNIENLKDYNGESWDVIA